MYFQLRKDDEQISSRPIRNKEKVIAFNACDNILTYLTISKCSKNYVEKEGVFFIMNNEWTEGPKKNKKKTYLSYQICRPNQNNDTAYSP